MFGAIPGIPHLKQIGLPALSMEGWFGQVTNLDAPEAGGELFFGLYESLFLVAAGANFG